MNRHSAWSMAQSAKTHLIYAMRSAPCALRFSLKQRRRPEIEDEERFLLLVQGFCETEPEGERDVVGEVYIDAGLCAHRSLEVPAAEGVVPGVACFGEEGAVKPPQIQRGVAADARLDVPEREPVFQAG